MKKIIMGLFVFVMILSANTMITNAEETENTIVGTKEEVKEGTDVALGTVRELFEGDTSGTCDMGSSITNIFRNSYNGGQTVTFDTEITQSMADKVLALDFQVEYLSKECVGNLKIFRNAELFQIRDQARFNKGSMQALFDVFGQMPKLQEVFIGHINVRDSKHFPESITFSPMPNLEKLELRYLSVLPIVGVYDAVTSQIVHDGGSFNGVNFPKLKTLWLDSTVLDDYSGIGTMTTLEKLDISGAYNNEFNIDWIGKLTKLNDLDLNAAIPDLSPIGELKSLKSLSLTNYEYNSFRDAKEETVYSDGIGYINTDLILPNGQKPTTITKQSTPKLTYDGTSGQISLNGVTTGDLISVNSIHNGELVEAGFQYPEIGRASCRERV